MIRYVYARSRGEQVSFLNPLVFSRLLCCSVPDLSSNILHDLARAGRGLHLRAKDFIQSKDYTDYMGVS